MKKRMEGRLIKLKGGGPEFRAKKFKIKGYKSFPLKTFDITKFKNRRKK